jgi:hypothetical protein
MFRTLSQPSTLINVDAQVDKEPLSINALAAKIHVSKKFLHPHSVSVENNAFRSRHIDGHMILFAKALTRLADYQS